MTAPSPQRTTPTRQDVTRQGTAGSTHAQASTSRRRVTPARVSSTVVSLGIVSLLTDVSSEAVAAILPLYMTTALGLTTIAYGLVDGVLQGASSVVRIAAGWAADRGGHPKRIALVGYAVSALTRLGMFFAGGAAALVALVAADRFGKGIRTAPRDAMIAASSTPRTLGRSFGVHRALDTVGASIGPLLAFTILWVIPDGYTTVFVTSFGAAVVGVAVLAFLVPDVRSRRADWLAKHQHRADRGLPKCKGCTCDSPAVTAQGGPSFSWAFLREPAMRRTVVVAGVLALLTVGDGFVYLALQDRDGFAAHWFPLLYVGTNLAYMSLAVPFGRLADRVGRLRVFVAGHVALLLAYVCAAGPGAPGVTVGALVLLGAFYAATDGVLPALAGAMVPGSVRASAIGTVQTAVAAGRLASSVAFGVLWYALGRGPALWTVTALLAVCLPVAVVTLRGHGDAPDPARSLDTAPAHARPDGRS